MQQPRQLALQGCRCYRGPTQQRHIRPQLELHVTLHSLLYNVATTRQLLTLCEKKNFAVDSQFWCSLLGDILAGMSAEFGRKTRRKIHRFEKVGTDRSIILKWMLDKFCGIVRTAGMWFNMQTDGQLCELRYGPSGSTRSWQLLDHRRDAARCTRLQISFSCADSKILSTQHVEVCSRHQTRRVFTVPWFLSLVTSFCASAHKSSDEAMNKCSTANVAQLS